VLATLATSSTERSALQGAIERIAECFESEVGAVIGDGAILASIGFRRNGPLPPALFDAASGGACKVDVPGAGPCLVVVVPVPSVRDCRLVLARSGDDGFSLEEVSLLRSIGRILATALDMLHLRDRVADSESRFRRIVETANEGIWLLDADGATTFANGKMAEILGYAQEEMAGLTLFDVVDEEGKPYAAENLERRRNGLSDQLECAFLRKDRTYVWVLLNASPLFDSDGAYVGSLCMVSDITPRKRIEDELAAARDAAMESSRLKSDFLATMSHEIRTPMNGVIGLTGLLLTTDLDECQRQYADGVQAAGEGLLAIINDILDLSKIESGRLELEVIDFDLLQVIEEAAGLVAASAQRKGLELLASCRSASRWPTRASASPTRTADGCSRRSPRRTRRPPGASEVPVSALSSRAGWWRPWTASWASTARPAGAAPSGSRCRCGAGKRCWSARPPRSHRPLASGCWWWTTTCRAGGCWRRGSGRGVSTARTRPTASPPWTGSGRRLPGDGCTTSCCWTRPCPAWTASSWPLAYRPIRP
jgi:PAS domain S-box-containing protein